MKITLPIKAISVNVAFQGRRFKTKVCKEYDKTLDYALLPYKRQAVQAEWYVVEYRFYIKNYAMSDGDNMVKVLQDGLVRNGLLSDDRRIKRFSVEKFKSESPGILIEIAPYLEGAKYGDFA